MKFFFPDAQDLVDPGFDFEREEWSENRIRQRDDHYAHEIFNTPAFDGILISKGIVDGFGNVGSRYTMGQRHRLTRSGVKEFLRIARAPYPLEVMGDCGAFTYVNEPAPPYSVDEVISFYVELGFDLGISVDHVILAFDRSWDKPGNKPPADLKARQDVTLTLAREFLKKTTKRKVPFKPIGVAQGWSPKSYAKAVAQLQKIGYSRVALGGMVPLKSADILSSLATVSDVLKRGTEVHLLGVTRTEHLAEFAKLGVTSFDSTSPLRQAFKDDKDNYYTPERAYTAVRIPQVDANPGLQRAVASGRVSQDEARRLERLALETMRAFDRGRASVEKAVNVLVEYESLYSAPEKSSPSLAKAGNRKVASYAAAYREVLTARPWKHCACNVCRACGYHVILFRGAERNRRRGFHNLWVFYRQIRRELGKAVSAAA